MFKVGDLIVYSGSGVCMVEGIGEINLSGMNSGKTYYTMKPQYGQGIIYIPFDTDKTMRFVLSSEDVQGVIEQIPTIPENIYTGETRSDLTEDYLEFFKEHNCEDLIPLIKTIYVKPSTFNPMGKRIAKVDKNFIRQTEDLLFGEFAEALNMDKNDVRDYVEDKIQTILVENYGMAVNS